MNVSQFAVHIDRMSQLIQLGQLRQTEQYYADLNLESREELAPWLSMKLQKVIYPTPVKRQLTEIPNTLAGWQAYHAHDYLTAHQLFRQALQACDTDSDRLNIALGLCKVYTRSGHWHTARAWALYYLSLARQCSHPFEIAKGYGALAEIFLRANYAKEALSCFQTAYHLMPLGNGQQARQLNFIASALMRKHEWLRAETLLYTSSQISRNQLHIDVNDQDANNSLQHSRLRLLFIHYLNGSQFESDYQTTLETSLSGRNIPTGLAAVPYGHMQVLQAMQQLRWGNNDSALTHLNLALAAYSPRLIMEYQWAINLKNALLKTPQLNNAAIEAVFSIDSIQPPQFTNLIDLTWQTAALTNQGFKKLIQAEQTVDELFELWTLFFI